MELHESGFHDRMSVVLRLLDLLVGHLGDFVFHVTVDEVILEDRLRPLLPRLVGAVLIDFVVESVRRESSLSQTPVEGSRAVSVNNCKDRDADNHSDESEESAAYQHREQYPEASQACAVSQDLRSQDVAVKLLERDDEYDEIQAVHRVDHQKQQRRRDRSDERSEERDDVRDADDAADQQAVLPSEDAHDDEAQDTDDDGIDDLAADESSESLIRVLCAFQDLFCSLFLEVRDDDLLRLRRQRVFDVQDVDADDNADHEVEEESDSSEYGA